MAEAVQVLCDVCREELVDVDIELAYTSYYVVTCEKCEKAFEGNDED